MGSSYVRVSTRLSPNFRVGFWPRAAVKAVKQPVPGIPQTLLAPLAPPPLSNNWIADIAIATTMHPPFLCNHNFDFSSSAANKSFPT